MANSECKYLSLKRRGWKRIAKNTISFGWEILDATDLTRYFTEATYTGTINDDKVEITPHEETTSLRTIELTFTRDRSKIENLTTILALEFFYNIAYHIRKFFSKLMKISTVLTLLITMFSSGDEVLMKPFVFIWYMTIIVWFGARIVEGLLARIARNRIRILK